MNKVLTLLFLGALLSASAQEKNLNYYYSQAKDAYRAKDYAKFYAMIKEAHQLNPYHQGILYQYGMAAALTGHKDEAIAMLKNAVLIDASFRIEGLPDFNSLKALPAFQSILQLQKELETPVIHSDTAFVLRDRSLHCEGIEYDAANQTFYLGSIHKRKIIKVNAKGEVSDFCPSAFEGMTSVFGIKVDAKLGVLWTCTSPMQEMENYDSAARSAVFKFDLSGKLLAKYQRPRWDKDGVFGDLVLNKDGLPVVSDSQNNTLLIVNEKSGFLEPYFDSPEFWNIQGLAFSPHDKFLFISDYIKGLFRLEPDSRKLVLLTCQPEISLKGIDGLVFYHNELLAIQNGVNPLRATRLFLNSGLDKITGYEVIDRKHQAFNEPTLGVAAGKWFYYIANSQWSGYDKDHHLKPNEELQDIVILKYDLGKKRGSR